MNGLHQIEPTSQNLMASLALAIDEAKLARQLYQARSQEAKELDRESCPYRLLYLSREIELLEDKLEKLRKLAQQG